LVRIAVISDVHANLPALEAVLTDVEEQAATQLFCVGDLVGQGPHPNQVVSRIRKAGIPSILGNQEIEVRTLADRARPDPKRHMLWTIAALKRKNRDYLLGLPAERELEVEEVGIRLVHGSPRGTFDGMYSSLTSQTLRAWFPDGAPRPGVLVGGHTHLPFVRTVDGMLIVNAGSVGRPLDGDPRASWALLEVAEGHARARIRRVRYPVAETVRAMKRIGMQKWRRRALELAVRRWPMERTG
jgi:predicted phosphodiesterase